MRELWGWILVVVVSGCSQGGAFIPVADLTTVGSDGGGAPADLTMTPASDLATSDLSRIDLVVSDLTVVAQLPVGAPCAAGNQCLGKNPQCLNTVANQNAPNGYCSNQPCVSDNDCGGNNAFCAQSGYCVGKCDGAGQCQNLNPDNRCYFAGGVAGACLPSAVSQCDPTKGLCSCLRNGLDNVGVCLPACTLPNSCANGQYCLYYNATVDANGKATGDVLNGLICLPPAANLAGNNQPCTTIDSCGPGYECDYFAVSGAKVCKQLCRNFFNECTNGGICSNGFKTLNFQGSFGAPGLCI